MGAPSGNALTTANAAKRMASDEQPKTAVIGETDDPREYFISDLKLYLLFFSIFERIFCQDWSKRYHNREATC